MGTQERKWGALDWLMLVIALVPIVAYAWFYDRLPKQMASHFNSNWEPDDYQGKFSFFVTAAVILFLPIALKPLSKLDPKRENYAKFGRAFAIFRLAVSLLISVSFGAVLLYNLGYEDWIDFRLIVLPLLGLFFMVVGNYMGQIRHNYSMGIRTPWTLSDEDVWRKTHRLAAPLWMIGGLLLILLAFFPGIQAGWGVGVILAMTAGVPTVASYFYYRSSGGSSR